MFTKYSQTVAHREKDAIAILCPDWVIAVPFVCEGAIQATSMDTTPQPRRRKSRSDLVHLRCLPSNQPATKIGQVIWAWKEIEAGLAAGMKLKEVWHAAREDGLDVSYAQFRVYISRLRRRRQRSAARGPQPHHTLAKDAPGMPTSSPADPFNNLREQREKKKQSGFEYDPFSISKNLIG
jgi:hypothetical protein